MKVIITSPIKQKIKLIFKIKISWSWSTQIYNKKSTLEKSTLKQAVFWGLLHKYFFLLMMRTF